MQLESQVAFEQSANLGLAGRVQHLEGEVVAKDTLDRLTSPASRASLYNPPPPALPASPSSRLPSVSVPNLPWLVNK